ncbi:MAG: hypothetical protein AAF829_13335 [Pseudomonadota bacterium]
MVRLSAACLVLSLWLATACSATDTAGQRVVELNAVDTVPRRGLPAQELDVGECGLFLWSLSGEPTFIFFAKATQNSATMLIGAQERTLARTASDGDIFGQFMTQMGWVSPDTGHRVDLVFEAGELLGEGQRISNGRIKLVDGEGWETIIPVAGVRACLNPPEGRPITLS